MSKEIELLRQAFNRRLENMGATTFYAGVKAVDETARTCTVEMEGIPYEGVLLYAVEKAGLKGAVMIPAVGSTVLVSRIGGERYFVAMFSVVDKIVWTAGEKLTFSSDAKGFAYVNDKVSFSSDASALSYVNGQVSLKITASGVELSADTITLNGGELGGMIKIKELTAKINALINAFNDHTHQIPMGKVAVTGSASSQSNAAPVDIPAITSKHTEVKESDYENIKIKQ